MDSFSKGQVDRLGSRLRRVEPTSPGDAGMYVDWSASFEDSLRDVESIVVRAAERADVSLSERTGRIKQLFSVIAKLRRMPTKLSGLDDIAGVRAVMQSDRDVNALVLQLATAQVKRVRDYRESDRNGYRAVHLTLLSDSGKSVELQLRTELQHAWAGLSERRAAVVDHAVKYGGGPPEEQEWLRAMSDHGRFLDLWRVQHESKWAAVTFRSAAFEPSEKPALSRAFEEEERFLQEGVERFLESCRLFSRLKR